MRPSLSFHDDKYYVKYLKMFITGIHQINLRIGIILCFVEDIFSGVYVGRI